MDSSTSKSQSVRYGRNDAGQLTTGIRAEVDRLKFAIEAEPVEDGISHPGEDIIAEIAATYGDDALVDLILETEPPVLAANLLRLHGRTAKPVAPLRRRLVEQAMQSDSVEVRDAMVQAVELWEDKESINLIANREEPVSWLADYIRRVAEELRE